MYSDSMIDDLCKRYPLLTKVRKSIENAAAVLIDSYTNGGKLLVCGNGGSSSDADHIVGELMKSFETRRPLDDDIRRKLKEEAGNGNELLAEKLEKCLPAISLSAHTALVTAISNDMDPALIFAQQVIGYGRRNDVLLGISTSGNSQNVVNACITARASGLNVIGLTGADGGRMKQYCDILINVPEERTAFVQELHLPVFHTICLLIEKHFYGQEKQ